MSHKQSLTEALHLAQTGKSKSLRGAANSLLGLPAGGWPETQQALRQLRDELPFRYERNYTIEEFVAGAYVLDGADRYRSRFEAAGPGA